MLCLNFSDIVIITVRCTIHGISRSEAIHLLENFVFGDRGYMSNAY